MTDELTKIREAYFLKANKDRASLKEKMKSLFGITERSFQHRLNGKVKLTNKEAKCLKEELNLTDREQNVYLEL